MKEPIKSQSVQTTCVRREEAWTNAKSHIDQLEKIFLLPEIFPMICNHPDGADFLVAFIWLRDVVAQELLQAFVVTRAVGEGGMDTKAKKLNVTAVLREIKRKIAAMDVTDLLEENNKQQEPSIPARLTVRRIQEAQERRKYAIQSFMQICELTAGGVTNVINRSDQVLEVNQHATKGAARVRVGLDTLSSPPTVLIEFTPRSDLSPSEARELGDGPRCPEHSRLYEADLISDEGVNHLLWIEILDPDKRIITTPVTADRIIEVVQGRAGSMQTCPMCEGSRCDPAHPEPEPPELCPCCEGEGSIFQFDWQSRVP